jgi:TRAP transporter TAXI family solute receptor
MRQNAKRILCIGFGLFILSILLQGTILPASSASAEVQQISMGTSSVGGLFYNIGSPIAQCINSHLPEVNVTAEFTEGSTENLHLIGQKKMHLAIISPMVGYFAREGSHMFKKSGPIDFRVVARLLPNGNVWATLKNEKTIKTVADIKGHKVGVGTGGIGVVSTMQLEFFGIDIKKDIKPFFLQTGALADALKDGSVDVSFLTKELAIMVTATHDIRVISWQEQDLKRYTETNSYFGEFSYPAGTFKGVDYEVLTPDNGIQLICDANMSDELVYKLTKTMVENLDCVTKIYAPAKELNPGWCASKLGNPFHPGAIKYYKEKGLWKE